MSLITTIAYIDSNESPHTEDPGLAWDLHEALTEDASWNNKYWHFHQKEILNFLNKLKTFYVRSHSGITIEALWSPDKVSDIVELSLEELEVKFSSNQIGTKTKYVLRK